MANKDKNTDSGGDGRKNNVPPIEFRFKKGDSRPAGAGMKKGQKTASMVARKLLEAAHFTKEGGKVYPIDEEGNALLDEPVDNLTALLMERYKHAFMGDHHACNMMLDRAYGKVPDVVLNEAPDDNEDEEINSATPEEAQAAYKQSLKGI